MQIAENVGQRSGECSQDCFTHAHCRLYRKLLTHLHCRSRRTSDSGLENAAKTVVLFPGSGQSAHCSKIFFSTPFLFVIKKILCKFIFELNLQELPGYDQICPTLCHTEGKATSTHYPLIKTLTRCRDRSRECPFLKPELNSAPGTMVVLAIGSAHKRRIELEDKEKVVASDWGDRILAALAVLPWFI